MLNRQQYLLTCLAEECAEVAQRATKALRFGLKEIQPGQKLDNSARLTGEFADLLGVFELLVKETGVEWPVGLAIQNKHERIEEFYRYAQSLVDIKGPTTKSKGGYIATWPASPLPPIPRLPKPDCPYCDGEGVTGGIDMRTCRGCR